METILDLIEMHNEHVDKMLELARVLLEAYPDIEDTPADTAYSEAFNGVIVNAISLCCEANSFDGGKWMTDEDWHVVEG
jgi:hypothetical protein